MRQDSAGFARYLAALDARHEATGRHVILVLDNGPCHISTATRRALAERAAWLEVIPLARYSPHLNPKEHEWRRLKRDHRGHLAGSLREFVDAAAAGLAAARRGGRVRSSTRCRSGGWTGTARSQPVAHRADPTAPRTASPASAAARTYLQVLSPDYSWRWRGGRLASPPAQASVRALSGRCQGVVSVRGAPGALR